MKPTPAIVEKFRPLAKPAAVALALLAAPLVLQTFGTHWVRIVDTCLLYVLLALGLNIVVGCAGLLDLGYVAFYAVGAYLFALLASPHLTEQFAWIAALFPHGLHARWWLLIPLADSQQLFHEIRQGNRMFFEPEGANSFSITLVGTSVALNELMACVRRYR